MIQTHQVQKLVGIFGLLIWSCFGSACRPGVTAPPEKTPGASLPTRISTRTCPHRLAYTLEQDPISVYNDSPCESDSPLDECMVGGCIPARIKASRPFARADWDKHCKTESVLCVGSMYPVKTLQEAAQRVTSDTRIQRILIANGAYQGSALFKLPNRTLSIEGESNDPKTGVRLLAPPSPNTPLPPTETTLSFQQLSGISLKRLVISGARHGLLIEQSKVVRIEQVRLVDNAGHGAQIRDVDQLTVLDSHITHNGQHPTHAPIYRFGLAIEHVRNTTIARTRFQANAAGGCRIIPKGALLGKQAERHTLSMPGLTVNEEQTVSITDSTFEKNGPVGWSQWNAMSTPSCDGVTCGDGTFCEAGACHPTLTKTSAKGDVVSLIGAGLSIAGAHTVKVTGTRFFRNDLLGMWNHTSERLVLTENYISRNGLRTAQTTFSKMPRVAALHVADIRDTGVVHYNVVLDNAGTGIGWNQVDPSPSQTTRTLALDVTYNHISGNGRFQVQGPSLKGAGFALQAQHWAIQLALTSNYFHNNRLAGWWSHGFVYGSVINNVFSRHPYRAMVWNELGTHSAQRLTIQTNTIDHASGYGLHINGSGMRVLIDFNQIQHITNVKHTTPGPEADGIYLSKCQKQLPVLTGNRIIKCQRAGIHLQQTRATVAKNSFSEATFPIMIQESETVGTPSVTPYQPPTPETSRTHFLP